MRLKDKVAIVTGAASGFGRGIAELYAAEGAKVVCADLNGDGAEAVARTLGEGNAIATRTDVTRRADVEAMVGAAVGAFGGIDIVVNNAGFTHKKPIFADGQRSRFRPHLCRQREIHLSLDACRRTGTRKAWRRRYHQYRLDGGRASAAGPDLV